MLVVVAMMEVGRTGAAAAGGLVEVDVDADGEEEMEVEVEAGHSFAPHARSVGQQPPPRVAGQEL